MLRSAVTVASRVMRLARASSRTAIAFYRPAAAAAAPVETIRPPLFSDPIRHKFSKAKYPNKDYDDDDSDDKDYSEPDDEPLDGFYSEESDFEGFADKDDDKDDGKNKKCRK